MYLRDMSEDQKAKWFDKNHDPVHNLPQAPAGSVWSGAYAVPAVGERVKVLVNKAGFGKVVGYFVEFGYLGVHVKLDKEPAWRLHRNGEPMMVFGIEVEI